MNFDRNGNLLCPTKPVPAQIIIGSNDGLLRDSTTSRNYWQFANGCQAATTPATPSPCVSHNGCAKPLMWCQVPNLGHQVWQSGGDASWDFFKAN
jgi:polyhydroxybutyrate depolymerase